MLWCRFCRHKARARFWNVYDTANDAPLMFSICLLLTGYTILVTRPAHQADTLCRLITQAGG